MSAVSTIARCIYRRGGAEDRFQVRNVHVAYMIRHRAIITSGGALLGDDGRAIGMFLHLQLDLAAAAAFLDDEPYQRAGLFRERTLERFDQFIPHDDPLFLEKLQATTKE